MPKLRSMTVNTKKLWLLIKKLKTMKVLSGKIVVKYKKVSVIVHSLIYYVVLGLSLHFRVNGGNIQSSG